MATTFNDANLEKAYNNIYGNLKASGGYTPLAMPEQTLQSITDQLAGVWRPQYESAIAQRYGATKQQKAAIDVDAASRGQMLNSTWVTDAKNRLMNAQAADIAGLERDYASQLAGDALNQYNNYLGDKLALDQYNQQLAQALGNDAYNKAMQQYSAGILTPQTKIVYKTKEVPVYDGTSSIGVNNANENSNNNDNSNKGTTYKFTNKGGATAGMVDYYDPADILGSKVR